MDDYSSTDSNLEARPTYWLTRFLILRLLGIVYAVAFLVIINQILPLIGSDGLLPINNYANHVSEILGSASASFFHLPSMFWFFHSDSTLITWAWIGFILSCIVVIGFANAPMLAALWFLYMSFMNIGQEWYGFGWEIQLLETGFLAIFLCPLIDLRPFPRRPAPFTIIILFRWLIFRIMLGSALIKLRGDISWRNGTALYHHFETQPIPGPLSRFFHFMPKFFLKAGVWFNFLAELIAPFFIFWPRLGRIIAGIIIIAFQFTLILSGNLSFLNWLTIVPALACFDDQFLAKILPERIVQLANHAETNSVESKPMIVTAWVITIIVGLLSIQPAFNLLSSRQIMNTSFDRLNLVNTYGAFGTVGEERLNVVFEGTMDNNPGDSANWIAYPYKGLPVALDKRPPQIAPYQPRLDWQMWFASMSTPEEYPWTIHLISKLLHNDALALSLFAGNPFPKGPPKYVRAILYRYSFVKPNAEGIWWKRERIGEPWISPLAADDPQLIAYLKSNGWNP
ncbi:MAG: membrane protein [Bacteroidetes bacterium]|nr:MAG: membrane protein [Bacteroidota bacterium]